MSTETKKLCIKSWIDVLLESNEIRNKKLQGSEQYLIYNNNYTIINYNKNLNSHEFTEKNETKNSSNKNNPRSSLEKSNYTKLNLLNLELPQLKSLPKQFIFVKKYLQEINDLHQ